MRFIVTAGMESGVKAWKFYQDSVGSLRYGGPVTPASAKAFCSSPSVQLAAWDASFFSQDRYSWLPPELRGSIRVFANGGPATLHPDVLPYLIHAGWLLLAVQLKDSLLAAELLNRGYATFMKAAPLTARLVRPVAANALFAWLYGRFNERSLFIRKYYGNPTADDVSTFLFDAARDVLKPVPEAETPEAMFIRYFRTHNDVEMTLGIVGARYENWAINGMDYLDSLMCDHGAVDGADRARRERKARNELFQNAGVAVRAEPYNRADPDAIVVLLDNLEASISGSSRKDRAGYIRAAGATILRRACPSRLSFPARLARVGNCQDGMNGVVIRMVV